MAKGILEFDLEDFEDRASHLRAVKADTMAMAIDDLFNVLRDGYKYGSIDGDQLTEEQQKMCELIRDKLVYILDDREIMDLLS